MFRENVAAVKYLIKKQRKTTSEFFRRTEKNRARTNLKIKKYWRKREELGK